MIVPNIGKPANPVTITLQCRVDLIDRLGDLPHVRVIRNAQYPRYMMMTGTASPCPSVTP